MNRARALWAILWLGALGLLPAAPARAASLQKVEQSAWSVSGLPSYVNMYIYVPDKLAPKPPILVASHHCGGSSSSTFNETRSSFVALADKNGFVIIFPEATGHNCWDVGSMKSLQHDGGGDTHAIAQMVRYALAKYQGDASRVYAFGTSSGAMMTEALLGVYPDLFMAGVSVAGVPCGCWSAQYTGDSGANPQWSGPCAGGNVTKTAQQWGDLVRSMFPSYTGHRPRVQLWHGTADTTISYKNFGESIKEWTNILQLDETPTGTDNAKAGYTHQTWKNTCGYVRLETWSQQGAGHDVSWDSASATKFLGLDAAVAQDPEATACPSSAGAGGMLGGAGTSAAIGGAAGASAGASAAGSGGGSAAGAGMNAAAAGKFAAVSGAGGATIATSAGAAASSSAAASGGRSSGDAGPSASERAGVGGLGPAPSGSSTVSPSGAGMATSSGGCSCVVCSGGSLSTPHIVLLTLAMLWPITRRRRKRTARRA